MYVNQDIAGSRVEYNSLSNIESICLELNLRKRKWLVIGIYKPPSYSEEAFIKSNKEALVKGLWRNHSHEPQVKFSVAGSIIYDWFNWFLLFLRNQKFLNS